MRSIIVFCAVIGLSHQMTNEPPTTREPSVLRSYYFHYDYLTHKMLVHTNRNCFIFMLTAQERMEVHTDYGRTALEVHLLQMITTGTKTEVAKSSLEHSVTQGCGNYIIHYYTVA
ncbi:hypothetical protein ACJMK2_014819 [Sinanodonta woodiana]|uniref:Lipocalin n=1 Tax=Sinanodonta woodiana TaxID=1069815 RepID=A0ABD3V250_SINWO